VRWLLLVGSLVSFSLEAQSPLYPVPRAGGGIFFHHYGFSDGVGLQAADQMVVPLFFGTPLNRRTVVDVNTAVAFTRVSWRNGNSASISGPTDTKIRVSHTIGRDVAVVSLGLNLPTGNSEVPQGQAAVAQSVAQNFIPFPVSLYGAGFGLNAGGAFAKEIGGWSLGAAGSLRFLAPYQLSVGVDTQSTVDYSPGLEMMLRVGARRAFEKSTFLAGLALSTYGTDELRGGLQDYRYHTGTRVVAEIQGTHQVGRNVLKAEGWVYYRAPGDSNAVVVPQAEERVMEATFSGTIPTGFGINAEPLWAVRSWRAGDGSSGWLTTIGAQTIYFPRPDTEIAPRLGFRFGRLAFAGATTPQSTILGLELSVYVRKTL